MFFFFHNDNNGGNNHASGRDGNTNGSNNNLSEVIDIKSIEPLTRYRVAILLVTIVSLSINGTLNYDPLDIDDDGMKF